MPFCKWSLYAGIAFLKSFFNFTISQGTLVEELCHQLRNLAILRKFAEKASIRLMCEGIDKNGRTTTVVVSVVSSKCRLYEKEVWKTR